MNNPLQPQFTEVITLIKAAQQNVITTANQELIKLYWHIGQHKLTPILKLCRHC